MSETLITAEENYTQPDKQAYELNIVADDYVYTKAGASGPDDKDVEKSNDKNSENLEDWFLPLYNLVMSNANVVRRWPWVGTEMPLSKSMWNLAGAVNEGNVGQIIAQIYEELAKPEETEEEEDEAEEKLDQTEEKPEEQEPPQDRKTENNTETKAQKELKNPKIADVNKQSKDESDAKQPELLISQIEKAALSKTEVQAKAEIVKASVFAESLPPLESATSQTDVPVSLNESSNATSADATSALELPAASDSPGGISFESAIDESVNIAELELPESESPEPKPSFSALEIPEDNLDPATETIEVIGDEPEIDSAEHQAETDNFDESLESEEIIISHFETELEFDDDLVFGQPAEELTEDYFEPAELSAYDPKPADVLQFNQAADNEQIIQIDPTFKAVEDSLTQLGECIEIAEAEVAKTVNEIMDKIAEVPARLDPATDEAVIDENQAKAELEELFTELLEIMEIDYTPELVESLARLTIHLHLTGKIKELESRNEIDETPQGYGTHEIIKQLLTSLSTFDRPFEYAWALGRSVLGLVLAGPAQIGHTVDQRAA